MALPSVNDYGQTENRAAFKRGVAAAKRYYKALEQGKSPDYCAIIERADARNERHAWYDGFDSIANPEYFEE
jgi:hypothetical protein